MTKPKEPLPTEVLIAHWESQIDFCKNDKARALVNWKLWQLKVRQRLVGLL